MKNLRSQYLADTSTFPKCAKATATMWELNTKTTYAKEFTL